MDIFVIFANYSCESTRQHLFLWNDLSIWDSEFFRFKGFYLVLDLNVMGIDYLSEFFWDLEMPLTSILAYQVLHLLCLQ